MRLRCICGAEIRTKCIEELKVAQEVDCDEEKFGKHIFKIWVREE
jgi:hypothetical protein